MYKITFNLGIVRHFGVPPKILLIMKLVIIIMITCLVYISGKVTPSFRAKVAASLTAGCSKN
jgi:hypothetical protein